MIKNILITFILLFFITLSSLTYIVPAFSYCAGTADIDLDGDIDIILGHAVSFNSGLMDTITVMINDGNMGFQQWFIEDTLRNDAMCVGDFNNDSYPDFVTAAFNGNIRKYINNTNGGFEEREIIDPDIGATMLRTADLDNDGDKDILYFNCHHLYGGYFGVLKNDGAGNFINTFHSSEYGTTDNFTDIADINNDGFLDFCTGNKLYINNGDQYEAVTLEPFPQGTYIGSTALGDINNDNDIDQFCQGYQGTLNLRIQEDPMEFLQVLNFCDLPNFGWLTTKIYAEDLNNDGYDDLIYAENISSIINLSDYYIHILINNEGNNFTTFSHFIDHTCENLTSEILKFPDIDRDGDKDILFYGIFPTADVCQDLIDYVIILFNDGNGNFSEEPVSTNNDELQMMNYELNNYPNPFNPVTTISYNLPANVVNPVIEIFNIKGQKVKTLNISLNKREGTIIWDGTDNYQNQLSSGVYLYRIKSDEGVLISKKMLLLK